MFSYPQIFYKIKDGFHHALAKGLGQFVFTLYQNFETPKVVFRPQCGGILEKLKKNPGFRNISRPWQQFSAVKTSLGRPRVARRHIVRSGCIPVVRQPTLIGQSDGGDIVFGPRWSTNIP